MRNYELISDRILYIYELIVFGAGLTDSAPATQMQ